MFIVILNGQSLEHHLLYAARNEQTGYYLQMQGKQSDFFVATMSNEDNEDTRFICNKLLESCPNGEVQPGNGHLPANNEDENSKPDQDNSNDISRKYFENSAGNDMQSLTSSNDSSGQNITVGMEKIQQPIVNNTNATATQNIFKVYENSSQGIKVLYPSGWQSKQEQDPQHSVTLFLSPKENSADQVRERMLLRINRLPINLSLDDYTKKVIESQQNNTNFRIVESNPTILSGNPAYGLVGITNQQGKNVNVIDIWTIKNGIVYRLVFYSEAEKSVIFQSIAQKMIDTFTITK
jgi:hypothetical protein